MTTVISTAEDKIALMLGRALVRAEMLQARVEALEAGHATTSAAKPARWPARLRACLDRSRKDGP